jgi:aspartyl-tRNA(Asn)/glutamyl-tRNA(Gln) amidotransferase subunit B
MTSATSKYMTVIGLECHAQLRASSKLFCSCSTAFGQAPNANTCPVCLALPGALPVLNRGAVQLAVRAAQALDCTINPVSQWSRKNYFYPDLPKGYQISQFDRPFAENGHLDVEVDGKTRRIRIQRIHMEEDAGKSIHDGFPDSDRNTHIDLNRSGTPLVEIVTHPDIRSAAEAQEYLARLKEILEYVDVCDGNMEEGSLRCDANVSICRPDATELGTRTESKNINSFRFLGDAIDFEVERQTELIDGGGRVVQETRLWNSAEQRTISMRSKEEAHDYRYFPEPDLPFLVLDEELIAEIRDSQPELPSARRARFVDTYGLSEYDAGVLTSTRALSDYFEATTTICENAEGAAKSTRGVVNSAKDVTNWMTGDLLRLLKEDNVDLKNLSGISITPDMLARMIQLVGDQTISGKIAKSVIEEMYRSGKRPDLIIEERGLKQISNTGEIEKIVNEIIDANPGPVEQYRAGKKGTIGWFVGQVMKATQGRANPKTVNELLGKKLAG